MNQEFLLLAEFEQADIPLEKVAKKYLGLGKDEANKKARRKALPFPAFRIGGQKSEWFVSIKELSEYLTRERETAKREWEAMSEASRLRDAS